MHEYEMKFMASDRQQQLQAEALRSRQAGAARRRSTSASQPKPRGPVRLSLASLLRRAA